MSYLKLALLLFCLSLVSLTGCDDEPERLDGPVAEEDAKEEFSERLCYEWENCDCGELAGVSLDGCELGMEYAWLGRASDAKDSGLKYDGGCMSKRLNAMLDRGCAVPSVSSVPFCTGETCLIFHGDKTEGEECEGGASSADCKQGLVCLGTCQVPCANSGVDIAEGEVCQDVENEFYGLCAESLICDPTSGTCRAMPLDGEPCYLGQCADGLYCIPSTESPICGPTQPVGSDCTLPQQCESWSCGSDQKCAEAPTEGEACSLGCADNLVCAQTATDSVTPTCNKVPAKGESCLVSVEPCGPGLTCRDGVCDDRPKRGESCRTSPSSVPVQCADGLVCGGSLCSLTPSAPGCDNCENPDTCVVQVCTVIPPAVCGDSGQLLF